jgi:osmoprotectant transport system substrate-binding protein
VSVRARHLTKTWISLAVGLLGCAVLTTGCGLQSANAYIATARPGSIKHYDSLTGVKITVGSKEFTEQLILGNMLATLLQTAGADVTNHSNISGSTGVRNALLNGSVDISPEYTGTGWIDYLGHDKPIKGSKAQWQAVAKEDKQKNNLVWLPPAPENNTYAFAMGPEAAKKLKITKLSQIKSLPVKERTFCVEDEFYSRNDGFQPMLEKYGLKLGKSVPDGNISRLDTGVVYQATAKGQCNFGEVFTTDGRILSLHLKVLQDDKAFFPLYNVTEVINGDLVAKHPELKKIFAQVNRKITNKVMLKLNAEVDVDGEEPALVAHDWLQQEGFVK